MMEAALVLDRAGAVLYRHAPAGRTSVALPDSRDLWKVLWAHRAVLGGVAHTHPGAGVAAPSVEDRTTFAACEAGLGARLDWWIATSDQVARYRFCGPDKHDYAPQPVGELPWLAELRAL